MIELKRIKENPILIPNEENAWEAAAAFNPCVIKDKNKFHMLYRAMSVPCQHQGINMPVSSIGYAVGTDGVHFHQYRQLIKPENAWEIYGCEDPRVTKLDNTYYIFYTALSGYPFSAENIKVAVAVTKDLERIDAKHPVTPFNAKAMALFPSKIKGKLAAVLTVHTDMPPAKIAVAVFDNPTDIWSPIYWKNWYENLHSHVIALLKSPADQVEVGAPPIKTKHGWLLMYSYIDHYFSSKKKFTIEAALLDVNDPLKITSKTSNLLIPEQEYEIHGHVTNIVFPSGALLNNDKLFVYYGAADTTGCVATISAQTLINKLTHVKNKNFVASKAIRKGFKRYSHNPIIVPRLELNWERKGTLNPAAFYQPIGKYKGVHIIYRAFSKDDTSTLGYAFAKDGVHINDRPASPVYVPRESFEKRKSSGYSGCEDPRITKIKDKLYMLYTAFDGDIPRVALTSISTNNFLQKKWLWEKPKIISPHNIMDKNACLFPRLVNKQYVFLHRINRSIYIDFISKEQFQKDTEYLTTQCILMNPRVDKWDNRRIGAACHPIETKYGWVLFYHGISDPGAVYKVGAVLLDLDDPRQVLARTDLPLLKPEMEYENVGFVHNVVFPCGAIVIKDKIYLYYGGGDFVIGVAMIELNSVLNILLGKSIKT